MSWEPLKRGRKSKFNEEEINIIIDLASNQNMSCQQIATHMEGYMHDIIHYASVRHLLKLKNIQYSKGKIGRPKKL